MNLKIYNVENSLNDKSNRKPSINFRASGGICINKGAVQVLNLKESDKVEFAENQENKGDWYIRKSKDEKALPLRSYSNKEGLILSSRFICTQILAEVLKDSATIEIANTAEEDGWFSILTSKFKSK